MKTYEATYRRLQIFTKNIQAGTDQEALEVAYEETDQDISRLTALGWKLDKDVDGVDIKEVPKPGAVII